MEIIRKVYNAWISSIDKHSTFSNLRAIFIVILVGSLLARIFLVFQILSQLAEAQYTWTLKLLNFESPYVFNVYGTSVFENVYGIGSSFLYVPAVL